MAYDEELADRLRALVHERTGGASRVEEKRMFGGLAFMVDGHLAVVASGQGGILVRTAAADGPGLLGPHVEPMVMGGRTSRTWLLVSAEVLDAPARLATWVDRGLATVRSLPRRV